MFFTVSAQVVYCTKEDGSPSMVVERKEDVSTIFSTLKHMVAQADPVIWLHKVWVGWLMNITLSTAFRPHFYGFNFQHILAKVPEGKNCVKHQKRISRLMFMILVLRFCYITMSSKRNTLYTSDNTSNTLECIATMSALSSLKDILTGT